MHAKTWKMIFIYTGSIKSIVQHNTKNEVTENYILMFNDKKHFGKQNFKVVGAIPYSFSNVFRSKIGILKLIRLFWCICLTEVYHWSIFIFPFLYLPSFYSFISLQRLLWQCAKYEMYAYNVFFCCRKNMFFVLANESWIEFRCAEGLVKSTDRFLPSRSDEIESVCNKKDICHLR